MEASFLFSISDILIRKEMASKKSILFYKVPAGCMRKGDLHDSPFQSARQRDSRQAPGRHEISEPTYRGSLYPHR